MNVRRFPLPVSHSRAPVILRRSSAVLAAGAIFALGFVTAFYAAGIFITS